jgi:hypothetical protein
MGLLDDAIREHLELKRRHGADPEEVSRQEREALGAPVRGEFAQPEAAEGPAESPVEELDDELRDDEPPAGAIAATDVLDEDAAPSAGEAEGQEEDPWLVEELADEERAAEAPQEGEDVLEETPDFLQETPEHERLWFEQKPPRDFDWDS